MPSTSSLKSLLVTDLGRSRYRDAWELQREVFRERAEGRIPDVLILTEHEHVYTLGKAADDDHLLGARPELEASGIDVCHTDRGGDVTYHGPGQLVAYPLIGLEDRYRDVHRYLRELEEVVMRTLLEFGVTGTRDPAYTGVWVGNDKIAAIGVKVGRWTTMHGVALNVSTDLSYFSRIIPCGIFHKGVTSLDEVTGRSNDIAAVAEAFTRAFAGVFGSDPRICPAERLRSLIAFSQNETAQCLHA
jgi:lipoyl(octanoyl) transferase